MPYLVTLKHGEVEEHDGFVAALLDVLDCYTDARSEVEVGDGSRWIRIVGPDLD